MKEFEKWFKKAENDLLAIRNNLNSKDIPFDVCCFHSQQAAEKYLKAYLVARSADFPKTHDLKKLIEICLQFNPKFEAIFSVSKRLTEYGITPRYPDDFDDLLEADAQQAYQNALDIKDFVTTHFFD